MRLRSIVGMLIGLAMPAKAHAECALALVLALDVSSSIDEGEYRLQQTGLADAFASAVLRDALLGRPAYVSATVVHWSGFDHQDQVVPWTDLRNMADLDRFVAAIRAVPRGRDDQPTALAKGLQFAAMLLDGRRCARHVIDISGDGVSNWGVPPAYFADQGLFDGITINGLVIKGADPDPEPFYRQQVQRGDFAFVVVADSYADYPRAILRKLLREIGTVVSAR